MVWVGQVARRAAAWSYTSALLLQRKQLQIPVGAQHARNTRSTGGPQQRQRQVHFRGGARSALTGGNEGLQRGTRPCRAGQQQVEQVVDALCALLHHWVTQDLRQGRVMWRRRPLLSGHRSMMSIWATELEIATGRVAHHR